jgi:prolyl 4-hydroxylase
VLGNTSTEKNGDRTSSNTFLSKKDPVVSRIYNKISSIIGVPVSNFEDMQVARYQPGQEYKPHYDSCSNETNSCKDFFKKGKHRLCTFLLYLNDDFKGGNTVFLNPEKNVSPEKGTAVFFYNIDKDRNRINQHGGLPVIDGVKWIANCWVREDVFG